MEYPRGDRYAPCIDLLSQASLLVYPLKDIKMTYKSPESGAHSLFAASYLPNFAEFTYILDLVLTHIPKVFQLYQQRSISNNELK
jgi:hypothetical protein